MGEIILDVKLNSMSPLTLSSMLSTCSFSYSPSLHESSPFFPSPVSCVHVQPSYSLAHSAKPQPTCTHIHTHMRTHIHIHSLTYSVTHTYQSSHEPLLWDHFHFLYIFIVDSFESNIRLFLNVTLMFGVTDVPYAILHNSAWE